MLAPEMEIEDIIRQYPYLMGPLAELAESKGLKNLDEMIIKLNSEQKRNKIF